jgi:hypothetical protein
MVSLLEAQSNITYALALAASWWAQAKAHNALGAWEEDISSAISTVIDKHDEEEDIFTNSSSNSNNSDLDTAFLEVLGYSVERTTTTSHQHQQNRFQFSSYNSNPNTTTLTLAVLSSTKHIAFRSAIPTSFIRPLFRKYAKSTSEAVKTMFNSTNFRDIAKLDKKTLTEALTLPVHLALDKKKSQESTNLAAAIGVALEYEARNTVTAQPGDMERASIFAAILGASPVVPFSALPWDAAGGGARGGGGGGGRVLGLRNQQQVCF